MVSHDKVAFYTLFALLSHSDVCRVPSTGGFFCPYGCTQLLSAPYCIVERGAGNAEPCRASKEWPATNSGQSSSGAEDHAWRVAVKGLPATVTEDSVRELFARVGPVKEVSLHRAGVSASAAVAFHDRAAAAEAQKQLSGSTLPGGWKMIVSIIHAPGDAPSTAMLQQQQQQQQQQHWVLGQAGVSCSDTCRAMHATCDRDAMRDWVNRGVTDAAVASKELGLECCELVQIPSFDGGLSRRLARIFLRLPVAVLRAVFSAGFYLAGPRLLAPAIDTLGLFVFFLFKSNQDRSVSSAANESLPLLFPPEDCRNYMEGNAKAVTTCEATHQQGRRICVSATKTNLNRFP